MHTLFLLRECNKQKIFKTFGLLVFYLLKNTPLYGLNSYFFDNVMKKTLTYKKSDHYFLNLATFAFSTSVFHIMCKSSYGFHFIGSLYKMKKYKRIKKDFHFTSRSNLKFARNFIFVYEKRTKDLRPKEVY